MYDTARRITLVKQRVRENTRRKRQRGIYGLSAACMLLCAVLMQAAGTVVGPGQPEAWGNFGAMLLREDAGGYVLVFEPEGDKIKAAAITVALSFATFENVCYLIQNGADRFSFIFFRGFGTGAMHVLCGLIVGGGLAYTWRRTWLKVAGTCGLLGAAITLHATYNLLIAHGGAAQYIAYALPVLLVAAGRLSTFRLSRRE